MKRVLLITNADDGVQAPHVAVVHAFAADMTRNNPDIQFEACIVQQLVFRAENGSISITLNGQELHEHYDVVQLRNVHVFADYANAIRLYTDHYRVRLINRADAVLPYYGKVSQGFLMMLNGIATPSLISSPSNDTLLAALADEPFGFPLIIKHNLGIKGRYNYLVHSLDEAREKLTDTKQGFLAQPFVPNSGEIRYLRFGTEAAPLLFKKLAAKGTHLNNTSQGGSGELVQVADVETNALEHADQAAEIMGRSVAGVDILLGDDGKHYILEVNPTPSIATGVFLSEKQQAYADYLKTVEQES